MKEQQRPEDYASLLVEVKAFVRSTQYQALKEVNKELVGLYWDIGRLIVERQTDAAHGATIVERLAEDLCLEFPGVSGYSRLNIFYMRDFYQAYADLPKVQPLVSKIGWTQNLVILQRCNDPKAREFYIRMTRKYGWSKEALIEQIDNQSYEKTLLGQTNFDQVMTLDLGPQSKLAVRDEYTFDFLELSEQHFERELERTLIARVENFLRAMGGCFAFVGSQFRLEVDDEQHRIDLLLFHRRLRCLVAVELKEGASQSEFVGKMRFYLNALDRQVREEGENASIGIILYKEKQDVIVEYVLPTANQPIGAATYKIVNRLPKKFQGQLPSPEEIAKLLEDENYEV